MRFTVGLNMKGISDHDYESALQVWNSMEKKTLGCYHDACLKTDVLLLPDISEYVLKTLQVGSSTFLHTTWTGMAGLIRNSR